MTTRMFRGLLVATTAAAMFAASGAQAADAPKLSAGVAKQLVAAQKAGATKDWAAVQAAIDAAKQVSGRTPYDDYEINSFTMFVDANTQNNLGAAAAAAAMADSSAEPAEDRPKDLRNATSQMLQTKQFDKALPYAKALAATNPIDPATLNTIAEAYYFAKDYADAQALTQKRVDAAIAAKQKPDRNTLEILKNAQADLKDEAGAEKTLEILVANYNDPNDWGQIIDVDFGLKGMRDVDYIWLGRLLFVCGAPVSASDAAVVGQTASHLTFYGDAQTAQSHGGSGFPDANTNAAKDKATIPAQIAAGQNQGGQYNAKLAEALYSYGMYPQAAAAAQLAMTKGGATDAAEPPMVLAQALIAQGKYDDGLASLGQINGGGAGTARVVQLWKDYANIKKNPPAPAAAK